MYIQKHTIKKTFVWSEKKSRANFLKHGILFDEATTVWNDPLHVEYFDVEHSAREDRYIRYGHSSEQRLLVVIFCEKDNGKLIRIISARLATLKERRFYEERI